MKINAQEIVLLNRRNMKNGESAPQTTTETTVSNPEQTMNALNLQGMNNISFQGVNAAVLKNIGKKALIPLAIAAGAFTTQSCDKALWDPNATINYPLDQGKDTTIVNITNQVTSNVTVTIIKESDELLAILMQLLDNIQNDNAELRAQVASLIDEIKALREDMNKGLADIAEAQKRAYEQQLQTYELMKLAYANDLDMAAKLATIETRITEIKALVAAGNLSFEEASAEIQKLLQGISGKLDGIYAAINTIQDHVEKLVDQGKLNNTQNELIAAKLENLTLLVELGQLDRAKAFVELYGISNEILNQLIENNKYNSEELSQLREIQGQLANILLEVQKGNMDAQEGFNKISELLDKISGQLTDIEAAISGELNKVNTLLNELVEQGYIEIAQNQSLSAQVAYLTDLIKKGDIEEAKAFAMLFDINKQILTQLIVNNYQNASIQGQLNAALAELNNIENAIKNNTITVEEGNKQVQDLINDVKTELENINGSLDDIKAMLHGELNKINTQLNTLVEQGYINIAQNQSLQAQVTNLVELVEKGLISQEEALAQIYNINKQILSEMIENNRYNGAFKEVLGQIEQDLTRIENAIENQDISVEVGTDQLEVLIGNLSAQLEKIQASLDKLLSEVSLGFSMVEAYNKSYEAKWNKLMNYLANFDGDLATLIEGQKDIKYFLNEQLKELNAIKKAIAELDITSGGDGTGSSGITVEELKDMLKGLGDYYYNSFENFVKDNLPSTAKIDDLLASIDKKLDNLQKPIDYSDDLAKITSLLEKLAARPDYSKKLDKIIELLEQFECNCQCGGSNEGIIGDLEDMLQ